MITEEDIIEILSSPEAFFRLLKIVDKTGKVVELELNEEQKTLLELWKERGSSKLLILKPRQIGSSTFFTALLFYLWYISPNPIKIASMAHTAESAKNFMTMFKGYWENLPELFRDLRQLSVSNTTTLQLADTGATLQVKTAGAQGGTRSFSFNILHMSEMAFYSDVEELMATALPALNDGDLFIESTPNYWLDGLHTRILQAAEGKGSWKFHFFKWSDHKEYSRDEEITLTDEEKELQKRFELENSQLAWRRAKIEELGYSKFKRDFPLVLEDAYSQTGDNWLGEYELKDIEVVEEFYEEPSAAERYAIGVDVSLGVGKDFSVIFVVNVRTNKIAYMWESNTTSPSGLAERINAIGLKYNKAKVLVESNNMGLATLVELYHYGYPNIWTEDGAAWTTTTKTKPLLLDHLRSLLSKRVIKELDLSTIQQLRSLQVKGNNIILPTSKSGHCDRVMALAFAYWCAKDIYLPSPQKQNTFFEDIAKRAQQRMTRQHSRY